MTFLYPGFLLGLLALAIPVIIHLFNFRKTKKIYFSNTLFLKKVKEASSSKLKLKHYLVLFSRLLFLFFLVMAFAQPFIPSEENLITSGKNIIYLDNSWSMSNNSDVDLAALDAAGNYLQKLLEIYPENTEYKVLTNDFEAFSNTYKSKTEVADYLTELRYSGSSRSAEDIAGRLQNDLDKGVGTVYWISDFQRSMYNEHLIEFDSTVEVNGFPTYFNSYDNVYVDSVFLDNPFLIGDAKPKLSVVIRNNGLEEKDDMVVKVLLNDAEVATGSVTIPGNDKKVLTFDLAFDLKGSNQGRITFEEFPVTFDNDFYFALDVGRKINILEIKETDSKTPIENVYGNAALFNFQSFNSSNLDYGLINSADLVILNGITSLDAALTVPLNDYMERYGNLFIVPAYKPDVTTYRQIMGLQRLTDADTTALVPIAAPDFQNPFFQDVFEDNNPNMVMPATTSTISWGADRTALLRTRTGKPFLSEIRRNGKLFIISAPLDINFTTFQNHALFVPVMYRIAVQSAKLENNLYHVIDEELISIYLEEGINDKVVKLVKDEEELIPGQRVLGNRLLLEIPKYLLSAGFYDVKLEEQTLTSLAFNYSPLESDLSQLETPAIKEKFKGNVDIFDASDMEAFEKAIQNKYIGVPLWKYAILLALVFFLAEALLIRFLP
ncbi:hypothetical protein FNH22_16920 [Fulvivirga sp. M361]|uniref:BatA domain-containing protein n=1 Tax=Fulvivirga sp. M361 TaxID=2594266 RepID=UPI00117BB4CF|nr:BatA domain-containing protein [Fulvivirga sp. M361]TRX56060.1 hypothetical protein FNH22_16920 [Fulvivirga sp. M361]